MAKGTVFHSCLMGCGDCLAFETGAAICRTAATIRKPGAKLPRNLESRLSIGLICLYDSTYFGTRRLTRQNSHLRRSTCRRRSARSGSAKQFVRVAHRNGKIGAPETTEDGEVDSDDFASVIEERATGTAGGGCGVVNDLVFQNVAYVALRGGGPNQVLLCEPGDDLRDVGSAAGDLLCGFRACAG